ncbi:Antirestriction protein (plasmid) [Marinibacterium anthonyi]|nr:Antirestriction protein [Marinibacterium anthonyi]
MTKTVLIAEKFQNGAGLSGYVAELGAAFLCADLGIAPEPREDHASYIRTWLEVLKGDKKAIFSAAAKASQAASWLMAKGEGG